MTDLANLWATIASMWLPLTVLTVAGLTTLAVAWWATLQTETRDGFLWGEDTE